jgi:hypothetical protein
MVRTSTTGSMMSSTIQKAAAAVGAVFLLVGVLGFIPGITTSYAAMKIAGHESDALLIGVFEVSVLHNVVHLLFGAVGLLMARTAANAVAYLVFGGAIYFVLWLYGVIIDLDSSANFVPVNDADNWLHPGLAIGMIGLGAALARSAKTVR